jgi:xylan 1,4-beta-xylosidase
MVPHSDFFSSDKLNPEWSFLGYTPGSSYSLTTRSGWLTLSPKRKPNTIIKNDGEHNYSIITRLDFAAQSVSDQAGIWIFNGLQTLYTKLYSSLDSSGNKIVAFSYSDSYYETKNPAATGDNILLLKIVRVNHVLTGYFSLNGYDWNQVGSSVSVVNMDNLQANYNAWTGNRQGLFVQGNSSADFDYYLYRDAYTPILAECPANQYGTSVAAIRGSAIGALNVLHDGDWVLYAGVEFGNGEYQKQADSLAITASCASAGGVVEVWLDSLDSKSKIAECSISNTGSWDIFNTFAAKILTPVSGNHDVYLKFTGTGSDKLFMLQWLTFVGKTNPATHVGELKSGQIPGRFILDQNFPNPFNPATTLEFRISSLEFVTLKVFDVLGREVATLVNDVRPAGVYTVHWEASSLPSGVYFYRLRVGDASTGSARGFNETKKMVLAK